MFVLFAQYFVISFLITLGLTLPTVLLARKFGLTTDRRKRKHPAHTHRGVIPRGGGLPIFLGIALPVLFLLKLNPQNLGILTGGLILVLVGLWDDKKDRSPYVRFFINCLAAVIVILFGVSIPYITNPLGGVIHFSDINFIIPLPFLLAFLWIVWTTNIIGWSGGVDGQLPGFVGISAVVIGLLSLRFIGDPNQFFVTAVSFITAGAFLGFLPWNFYPQKIMPGYGGKTLAGFMLAVLSALSFAKFGTALLVLAVPMSDAVFVFISRLIKKQSPFMASGEHLHHHLLNIGWSKRKIALFYWGISLIAGLIALALNPRQKLFAVLLVFMLIFIFILWINFFQKLKKNGY